MKIDKQLHFLKTSETNENWSTAVKIKAIHSEFKMNLSWLCAGSLKACLKMNQLKMDKQARDITPSLLNG